ncbi:DUF2505 domain-containing protein [Prauserella muralis]|uniref:Uncharacterized protein n=1 Tax=Prauserella muralis TaxID=588067 RepID=A0A2V4BBU3_9PSEU|nr:DUF2505 domain-containing protein [Prauserella muralis]PXY32768.1 hypothetical protein BAY60_06660 [Prauserella muralis]TWE13571.1 uncharacterized protein DUF2505 [Prauserella muralis]
MASRIEHRATFPHSVADVLAADSGEEALRARLAELGGKDARLQDHTVTADGVRYTLLQGVAAEKLPQAVRTIHKGDLLVTREHVWTGSGDRYTGSIRAHVGGVPSEITARTELVADGDGSVLVVRGEAKVRIPIVGGKLESYIAEQVSDLLRHESGFTAKWLERGS